RQSRNGELSGATRAFDRSAGYVDNRGVDTTIVLDGDRDRCIAVEGIGHDRPVELLGKRTGRAAGSRYHREAILHIGIEPRLAALEISDQLAVRAPGEELIVGSVGMRQPARRSAGPRLDDIDLRTAVWIERLLAGPGEGDQSSVRRPGGQVF